MAELARRLNQESLSDRESLNRSEQQLQAMPTTALMKQAMSELKLLAKAEVLHARLELQDELRQAKSSGILLGFCLALVLSGLSVALVGVALALPLAGWLSSFIVAAVLLATAAICGAAGYRRLPKKPLQKTQQRLKDELAIAREQFA